MKLIFGLIAIVFFSCQDQNLNNKSSQINKEHLNESKTKVSKLLDSLTKEEYRFTKEIDFFNLDNADNFLDKGNADVFYAYKKEDNNIIILHIVKGKIYLKRIIEKYTADFSREHRLIDLSDGGVFRYLTYYYSKDKIIIIEAVKSIFEESSINTYLSSIYIVSSEKVTEYKYPYNYKFHLKEGYYSLSEEKLDNIEKIALTLFPVKENVRKDSHSYNDFKENFFWLFPQLYD